MIVIVIMFALVFLVLGAALFVMNRTANSATHLERKDVKAFNVAEAGVDAAMVELKGNWPRAYSPSETPTPITVDAAAFRNEAFPDKKEFPDPTHDQFITVITYDDSGARGTPDDPTTYEDKRVFYDANKNDVMWIDAEALVDNARHRILVQVERLSMPVEIPDVALVANTAGGNGQGLNVAVDPDYTGSIPAGGADVWYTGKGTFNKDVNAGADIEVITVPNSPFSEKVPPSLIGLLKQMAMNADPGSYFDDSDGADAVAAFLCDQDTGPGSIVYFETASSTIQIAGNDEMGTAQKPVILIVDATAATNPVIDWRGTSAFNGVLIVIGDVLLRGTHDIAGCVLSDGAVENKGGPGVLYNGDYIRRVNQMHTLSVALVPNTWEEYTIPKATTTTATP